jgi:hypothetical protein
MNDMFDIPAESSGNLVDVLKDYCSEAIELDEAVKGYELAMKTAKSRLHSLRTIKIPEAMAEAGIGDVFSMDTGHVIKLKQFVSGSMPKEDEKRDLAMKVLAQHGGAALIKTAVGMIFDKGQAHEAQQVADNLRSDGYDVSIKEDVNAMSLQAFAREKLRNGEELPLEALGLFAGTTADIKEPKR